MKRKEYIDARGIRRCLFCGSKILFARRLFCGAMCGMKFSNLQRRLRELERVMG